MPSCKHNTEVYVILKQQYGLTAHIMQTVIVLRKTKDVIFQISATLEQQIVEPQCSFMMTANISKNNKTSCLGLSTMSQSIVAAFRVFI